MKMSFRSLLLISILTIGVTACGSGDDKSSSSDQDVSAKQVLNVAFTAPIKTLDVSKAMEIYSSRIFSQTLEGLTIGTVDKNGNDKIIAGSAKSWETTPDGIEWTFHLRDSNWNDGKPVVADDFKYSVMRTLDPHTASQGAYMLFPIKNASKYNSGKAKAKDVGIKVIDDHTIKFTLEHPTAYFLDVTLGIVPQRKDVVEKNGTKNGSSLKTSNMGNGPFKLAEWIPSNRLILVKNNAYWDAKNVKLQKINISIVLESSALSNMLLTGQLDLTGVSEPEWIKKIQATGKFNRIEKYAGSENHGIFNLTDKVFKNIKIRQAFSLAVTRKNMANIIFHGVFTPAYGWTPPNVMVGNTEYRAVTPEPLLALKKKYPNPKALLVAGLKELGMDPNPSHLTVHYLNVGSGTFSNRRFEYYQQMWHKTLGVNIKGDFVQWPVFLKKLNDQDFQVAGLSWSGGRDANTFFDLWTSKSGMYNIGFKSAEYDSLIAHSQRELDPNKRLKMFQRAEQIIVNDQAIIFPTLYRKLNTFASKKVHGLVFPTFVGSSYKNVYIK